MIRKGRCSVMLLIVAGFPLAVWGECYRFDSHLAEAKQVTVTPVSAGVGSRTLFSPEGSLAWQLSGASASSQIQVEGDRLVLVAKEADSLCSPKGLELGATEAERLEVELCVTGQDAVQIKHDFLAGQKPYVIAVPQQGQFFTARIDLRNQNGGLFPRINQIKIGVAGAARLEIRAVRAVPPLLAEPVGVGAYMAEQSVRHVLFAHCPMALEYPLRVPRHGFFAASLDVFGNTRPVAFRVEVRCGDATTTVLTRTVEAADAWDDVEADLSAFAGQDVTMTLGASCDTPGQVALWGNPAVLEKRVPGVRTPPNIVFYVVDDLRPDHLDAYGYPRKTAPEVAAFSQNGARFAWCLSQATWTPESVPSFLAGIGPLVHKTSTVFGESIPQSLVTFPELLRDAGYTTGAASDNVLTPPETAPRVSYGLITNSLNYDEQKLLSSLSAAAFLEANRDRPFFLYVHTLEVHTNNYDDVCSAPPPFRGMFTSGSAPAPVDYYDECIAFSSKNFGDFLQRLTTLGLAENTIVMFSSDHGEALLEHGFDGHGGAPYIELTHVPLIISWPGMFPAGKVFNDNVCHLDVAPTILDYAGVPIPAQFQGMSLRGLLEGTGVRRFQDRTVFSCGADSPFPLAWEKLLRTAFIHLLSGDDPMLARHFYEGYYDQVISAVKSPWAFVSQYPYGPRHLYNLALDPREAEDVASQNPEIAQAMSGQVEEYRAHEAELSAQLGTAAAGSHETFDDSQKEALKAMGYLGR